MKIDVIIEKGKKEFWGRIEGYEFLPVTAGKNINEVLGNLKMLIADYVRHEGQDDKRWKKIDVGKIEFNLHYDLRAFFDEYKVLNVSSVAAKAKINQSLLRQYVTGAKHPSTRQAKKVETAVRQIAEEINKISLVGSTL